MPKPFRDLREKLLHAGVAPRHVRRYLTELTDHVADLQTEEMRAGRNAADAESAALARLGSMDALAQAMIEQRHFQSWCARAPWAMFGLAPIVALAAAWGVALFILWSGWNIFLPGAVTPFGTGHFRLFDRANIYFQFGKAIYFFAPILVGWGLAVLAIRQRTEARWLAVGMVLVALAGGTGHVFAGRTAVPGGVAHVGMGFTLALVQGRPFGLLHTMIVLSTVALPYMVWRLQQPYSRSA